MPLSYLDPTEVRASAVYYVTMCLSLSSFYQPGPLMLTFFLAVNLTPYRSVRGFNHSKVQDLGLSRCHARQNTIEYAHTDTPVDANAEVFYALEGIGKESEIRGSTDIPSFFPDVTWIDLTALGLVQRQYRNPAPEASATVVITGSEQYGYISSINFGPTNWMHQLHDVIKDRQVPPPCDARVTRCRMGRISSAYVNGGRSGNTQTQGLQIYDQLRVGAR